MKNPKKESGEPQGGSAGREFAHAEKGSTLKTKMQKLIGTVGVESGQLLIVDPSNVSNPLLYDLASWASLLSPGGAAQLEVADEPHKFGTAIAFGRFAGDGFYEVYANYEGEALTSVTIDLKNQLWRDADGDRRAEAKWQTTQDENRKKVQELAEYLKAAVAAGEIERAKSAGVAGAGNNATGKEKT
jgi:hypothetical protein